MKKPNWPKRLGAVACIATAIAYGPVSSRASQNSLQMPTTGQVSGLQFSNDITDAFDALATCNSGSSAPTNAAGGSPKAGQCWIDTTSPSLLKKYRYTGAAWALEGVLDVTNGIWSPPIGGGTSVVASATTTSICGSSNPQGYIEITGTTAITSLGAGCPAGTVKVLRFDAALTLTYDATALILPGAASITTAAGDIAIAVSEGSGNWRIALYSPATGQAVSNPAVPVGTKLDFFGGTVPAKYVLGYGQALVRSSYPDWLADATVAQSGARTSGSPTITGLADASRFGPGMPVEGAGIPANTTISSVGSGTITLSANATTSGTSTVTVFLTGYGTGGDSTTVGVPDCRGRVVAGRGNMGGTDAARLTSSYFGGAGTAVNATGGNESQTLSLAQLPAFTPSGSVNVTLNWPASYGGADAGATSYPTVTANNNNLTLTPTSRPTASATFTGNSVGGGGAHPIVQPTIIADCIIRVTP